MGGAALIGVIFMPPIFVPIILLPICALVMIEFYALLDVSNVPQFKVVGTVSGLTLILGTWLAETGRIPFGNDVEEMLLFLIFAACFLRQLFHNGPESAWQTTAGTLLGVVYGAFLLNFMTKLLVEFGDRQGRYLLLFLVVGVKMTDIGAYFTGCSIGRHKLIPRVSPAKTWEGCIGGVLAGILGVLALSYLMKACEGVRVFGIVQTAVIGFFLAIAGILGDLIESLFKRAAGVKDSGTMIRGMGGILDVLDSLLFAAPVLYIAARIVA